MILTVQRARGNTCHVLAREVRRCEEVEIQARSLDPEKALQNTVVAAVSQLHHQNREILLARLSPTMEDLPAFRSEVRPVVPPAPLPASSNLRLKHKRESQEDVIHFSNWSDVGKAIEYARNELAPQEKEQGRAWRVLTRADGREDKSRDKQWRNYCTLAIAVGLLIRGGSTYEDAVTALQSRLDAFGAKAHTPLLRSIGDEIKNMRDRDVIAKEVLGY